MKHLKHILFTLFFFVLTVQLVQATVIYLEQPSYSQETSTEFCFSNAERRWLGLLYVKEILHLEFFLQGVVCQV